MVPISLAVASLGLSLVLSLAAWASDGGPPEATVIPPTQEPLLRSLLGFGVESVGAGCAVESGGVERAFVRARYTCADGSRPALELHPLAARPTAPLRTKKFAIVSSAPLPPAFARAFTARLRALEGAWTWRGGAPSPVLGAGGGSGAQRHAVAPAGPSGPGASITADGGGDGAVSPGIAPAPPPEVVQAALVAEQSRYREGLELYRRGRYGEGHAHFVDMVRRGDRYPGVIGMVVATLASLMPDPERLRGLVGAAAGAPSDPLAQFLAGVASHYTAHNGQPSVAEKRRLYGDAIAYLERCRQAFVDEPRLYVYLSISHFRLGHQAEAEALIEKGLALGKDDPDVHYCHAEIYQRKEPRRALAALEEYERRMAEIARRSGVAPEGISLKALRVERMLEHLRAVVAGRAQPEDLWDSPEHLRAMVRGRPEAQVETRRPLFSPGVVVALLAGVVGLGAALGLALWARRRRDAPPPSP